MINGALSRKLFPPDVPNVVTTKFPAITEGAATMRNAPLVKMLAAMPPLNAQFRRVLPNPANRRLAIRHASEKRGLVHRRNAVVCADGDKSLRREMRTLGIKLNRRPHAPTTAEEKYDCCKRFACGIRRRKNMQLQFRVTHALVSQQSRIKKLRWLLHHTG